MSFSLSKEFDSLKDYLNAIAPNEPEFHQAVIEVMDDLKPIIDNNEPYKTANVFERLVTPERIVLFQVAWQNDQGQVEVNRGYRVQFNSAIGPYKGGLRFHPSVNPSVLKFLAFEQTFKNSLTGLPMGGGKGGSDFDPSGRSDNEIMRFCSAFMGELHRHIGPDIDVPAGDINVGAREIGYLFGAYKRITNHFQGVLTGKELDFGGSELRTEATGYGVVYFLREMLAVVNDKLDGKQIVISGAGNVATHTAEKAIELGGNVISLSDSSGTILDPDGLTPQKLDWVRQHKAHADATLEPFANEFGGEWMPDETPWSIECDIAIPCATQNELGGDGAKQLIENGVMAIVEGANMPCTAEAKAKFKKSGILFGPGKAANAGGVAVSGLEITQNRNRTVFDREEIDKQLQNIMSEIHESCRAEGQTDDGIDYARGANIAGFRKVGNAMVSQGVG